MREDLRSVLTRDGAPWMEMDGQTLTVKLSANSLAILLQVYSLITSPRLCRKTFNLPTAVAYTKAERKRYPTSQTLPAFMTIVGCYGSEERLTDCSYHEFEYSTSASTATTSMDISISCSTNEGSTAQISGVVIALLVTLILMLTIVLIVGITLQRKKKRAERSL